jgi:N-acetylmuramoyl-L-alanine amidase
MNRLPTSRAASRGAALAVLAGLALFTGLTGLGAAGCRAPARASAGAPHPSVVEPATTSWRYRPLSWEKLEQIERWLDAESAGAPQGLVLEAELELAEGRVALARQDRATLDPGVLAQRLGAAEGGFRRVLAEGEASADQRLRAQTGMADVVRLRSGTAPSAPEAAGIAVLPRGTWRAASPIAPRLTRNIGPWTRITVHHSAKTTNEIGGTSRASAVDALQKIQRVHVEERGFGDIGYHFLIDGEGRVWAGRNMVWQGAHSSGANNVANIGICLLGDFDRERPDAPALAALERLVDALAKRHRIPRSRVYGHQELRATECPGRFLMSWVERYRGGLAHRD